MGGAAVRRLLEEGHTVRTLARDPLKAAEWSRNGVDVRRGDFNDAATVPGALEEVDAAYLMLPPEMQDAFNSGWIDFGVPGTEPIPGKVTPAQVFEETRKARGGI